MDYECFHVFDNSLLQYHELPLWFSGMQYGAPADIDLLILLSPAQFLAAGVGYLFHARSSLALFYGALQIEMFILGFGGYLLGRSLFRRLAPTVFLVTSLLLSTFHLWQISLELRVFGVDAAGLVLRRNQRREDVHYRFKTGGDRANCDSRFGARRFRCSQGLQLEQAPPRGVPENRNMNHAAAAKIDFDFRLRI